MKDVKGYEGLYAVTSCGKIWSYRSNKFLKPHTVNGYLQVKLCKNGIRKFFFVHRLVAEAYVPNPQGLETVDHIDGNKDHNYVNNLQWMTLGNNIKKSKNKAVYCVELDKKFESANEAARKLGIHHGSISHCCRGERQTASGYHWKFVKEGEM